ncbi:transposable element Tcb1 transposase [Trichonephila clavipes]|nr:transposable element Tcb1 transposase [Trichonephila clavipes]
MTGHIYRDVILEQHVLFFRGAMGAKFLIFDDNAHTHRANIVDECLQSEDITCIDCPAYSPDLNPIEHVWDMLGRRIAARQPPPTCLPELRRALLDEWCNIPHDQIVNLILSIPRRYRRQGVSFFDGNTSASQLLETVVRKSLKESFHYPSPMDPPYLRLATGSPKEMKSAWLGYSCSFLTLRHQEPMTILLKMKAAN